MLRKNMMEFENVSKTSVPTDLATYEGKAILGIDAGSTQQKLAWSVKMVLCFILSIITTTESVRTTIRAMKEIYSANFRKTCRDC